MNAYKWKTVLAHKWGESCAEYADYEAEGMVTDFFADKFPDVDEDDFIDDGICEYLRDHGYDVEFLYDFERGYREAELTISEKISV